MRRLWLICPKKHASSIANEVSIYISRTHIQFTWKCEVCDAPASAKLAIWEISPEGFTEEDLKFLKDLHISSDEEKGDST